MHQTHALPEPTAARLPRWRGFNLTSKFVAERQQPFREAEFALLAEWGFDFARLPLSYRCWSSPEDWRTVREDVLAEIDQAVAWGQAYGIHVNLNLHRAPGFCVNAPAEPFDLWTDAEPLAACAYYWRLFAERYRGIPNAALSFNLLNEPIRPAPADHRRVVETLVATIREADPDRLIIADGTRWAREPVADFLDLGLAQSSHVYDPIHLCFWRLAHVPESDTWPTPTWPMTIDTPNPAWRGYWDKARLREVCIAPWQALERQGVGIHVGEFACYNRTPHAVALAWLRDMVSLWREAGWGYALWDLHGPFGIFDSGRADVTYEDFRGRKLDRAMLEVLRADGT